MADCIGGGYLLNGIPFVARLWACGVAKPRCRCRRGLFLYAVGWLATIVPVTAGAVGAAEMAYIIAVY